MFVNNCFVIVFVFWVLEFDELLGIVCDFWKVVVNVIVVGFDGVEIYGVNGYLLD